MNVKKKKKKKRFQTGSSYGQMFSTALKRHGQLCIGLYRLHDQAAVDSNKRYVITNPPAELRLLLSDYVCPIRSYYKSFNQLSISCIKM